MTGSAIEAATQRIYESLAADNVDIDLHIANLKAALAQAGMKEVVLDPANWSRIIVQAASFFRLIFASAACQ